MRILIVIDHLRIGGAERVALDQAYELSDQDHEVSIVLLNPEAHKDNPNYLALELSILTAKNILLIHVEGGRFLQMKSAVKTLLSEKPELIIMHSLRGAVIFHSARRLIFHKVTMTVTIHQLPELSAPLQRYKRFLYAQTADWLTCCSPAMLDQWNFFTQRRRLLKLILSRKIELLPNGVYLNRLTKYSENKNDLKTSAEPTNRLISLGRNVEWKKPDILIRTVAEIQSIGMPFELLIMRPSRNLDFEYLLRQKFGKSVSFLYGRSASELTPRSGDIHLYPTKSGLLSQSSINVLEMSALGIPTLVSGQGGFCWPELVALGLLIEVDWEDKNSFIAAIRQINKQKHFDIDRARDLVNIKKNTLAHISKAQIARSNFGRK